MKQTNEWLQDVTTSQGWGQYRSIYFVYWVNFGLNFRHKAGWFVTLSSQCCEKLEVSEPILISREPTHKCALSQPPTMWQELTTWPALNVIWPPYTSRFTCLVLFCCWLTNVPGLFHPSPRLYRNKPVLHSKLNVFRANRYRKVLAGAPFQPFVGVFLIPFHEKHHFFIYSHCKTSTTKHHI